MANPTPTPPAPSPTPSPSRETARDAAPGTAELAKLLQEVLLNVSRDVNRDADRGVGTALALEGRADAAVKRFRAISIQLHTLADDPLVGFGNSTGGASPRLPPP